MKTSTVGEKARIFSLTLLAVTTCFTVLYSFHRHLTHRAGPLAALPQRPVLPNANARDVKHVLSPANHRLRDATSHHYHWNVTSGIRALDGFNKTVYLINGW